ncbi:hypothetical protein QL285_074668 [Trifolium repens]|nr:hypothetical protein QL285_074668 [Trifolium repens]
MQSTTKVPKYPLHCLPVLFKRIREKLANFVDRISYFDDRNFYGVFSISFSSKMTKTCPNTKNNLQNQGKASRPSPRCKKTRKRPKSEENVLIIVARWLPSCHDGSYLLAKKSTEKI